MKRILIFIFFIHLFLVETAKALDCRDTELLTDIAACKDQDIRHNLAKISEYENSFIKAHEQCKTQSCLRELYRKKAEIAEVMKGLLKPSEKLTDRLPDRAGIRQLVGEGKLLPLNKTLKEKFLKSDLWFFPYQSHNPEHEKKGVVKPFHLRYSDCSRGVMDYSCMSFLMTEQIDSLPEGLGGAVAIELYIPKDLVAPENPGHSEFYYLNKTTTELGLKSTTSCRNTDDIFKQVVCQNNELSQMEQQGNELLAQAIKEIGYENDAYDLARHDFNTIQAARECTTLSCIFANYKARLEYLQNREYQQEYQKEPLPQGCELPDFPEAQEIYAVQARGSRFLAEFKIDNRKSARKIDLWINRPQKKIVLILSAYNPVVWNLHITPQTEVQAVLAGGSHNQMIRGVSDNMFADTGHCLNNYIEGDELRRKARKLGLLEGNERKYYLWDKSYAIGERLDNQAYEFMPDKTIGLGIPLPLLTGQDGLDQQAENGNLLELNRSLARYLKRDNVVVTETVKNPQSRYPEDLSGKEPWPCAELPQQYACKNNGTYIYCGNVPAQYRCRKKSYLMWEQMDKLPEGLNGANAVRIYVPKDLKIPQEQGENQFYLLNKTRKEMTEIWEKPYIGGLELVYP